MSDIKLFQLQGGNVTELTGSAVKIEKSLQEQIERNLETYLGVRFLATEYSTGVNHGGRIDTFETDDERTYFLAILPVHPEVKKRGESGGHVRGQAEGHAPKISLNDTEKAILEVLEGGACSTSELLEKLGIESRTGAFRRNIKNLMENELIEYVYPDNPKHPDQKYRLKQHD